MKQSLQIAGATAFFSLSLMAVPAFADCNNDRDHRDSQECKRDPGDGLPPVNATPELGSLVLFGTGLAGAGSYALTRFRARRRRDENVEMSAT